MTLVEVGAGPDDEEVFAGTQANRPKLPRVAIERGLAKTRNIGRVHDRERLTEFLCNV